MAELPTWVKAISIFYYVYAILTALLGLVFIVASLALGSLLSGLLASMPAMFAGAMAGLVIVLGIIWIGFGVLYFFMGKGIANKQKWAKILAIIFSIIGLLGGISGFFNDVTTFGIVQSIITIIISAFIVYYFLINKEGKAW